MFCFMARSTDYGSTYNKLNDKVGSRTVLSYLYVCPTNKQKVSRTVAFISLSSPDLSQAQHQITALFFSFLFFLNCCRMTFFSVSPPLLMLFSLVWAPLYLR